MSDQSNDVQNLISVLASEATAGTGQHLEPELLAQYQAGVTDPDADNRIQAHLVSCRSCAQALVDLEDFTRAAQQPPSGVADLATASAYRAFQEMNAPVPVRSSVGTWRRRVSALAASLVPRPAPAWYSAVARAAVLVAVIGQSAWVIQLRNNLALASAPQVIQNPVYIEETRRDASGASKTLSQDQDYALLMILLDVVENQGSYKVEITDDRGQVVWNRGDIEISESTLAVQMPTALLPAGSYRIRVFAEADPEAADPVLDSTLRIQYQ